MLTCWGSNNGDGELSPPEGSFAAVDCGTRFACALDSAGHAHCWGADEYGQASPPDETFATISLGGYHACGITTAGELVCWGGDENGQATPPRVGPSDQGAYNRGLWVRL